MKAGCDYIGVGVEYGKTLAVVSVEDMRTYSARYGRQSSW
jgi:hypothetical protein